MSRKKETIFSKKHLVWELHFNMYRSDYHSHTLYSDGHAWPEDYIPFAVKGGLSELGFSDHLTLTDKQQDWSIKPELLDEYCRRILDLNKSCNDLIIRLGIEVDYLPGKEEDIRHILNSYPFDYVLGSVHYLDGETVDLGPEYYETKDLYNLYCRYFEVINDAASSGLFDIMAHPDLVRIFGFIPDRDMTNEYLKLARHLKKQDVAIEVNTNGRNKPLGDFYPDPAYLHIFCNEDIPLCLNSDTHFPQGVAQYFDEAYAIIIRSGYKEMATFSKRNRNMKSIRL